MSSSINIPDTDAKRIVIVGAGFAGLTLARKLQNKGYQIVLIDKNNFHQFQPLLYQVAMAGLEPSSIAFPLRKAFQKCKDVYIRVTTVEEIDTSKNEITTRLGTLCYDYLILSIGVTTNFFGNENLASKALSMKSIEEALYLRNLILNDYEKAVTTTNYDDRQSLIDIVIVGGGPTGVEVAGALVEMKNFILPKDFHELDTKEIDIHLIQSGSTLLKGMSEEAGKNAEKFLTEMGVKVTLNTRVEDFDGDYVYLKGGDKIQTNKVIWAAGITGNKVKGLPEDVVVRGNRIRTDKINKVIGTENVFAIGDIAIVDDEPDYEYGHPQVAQVAIQQGKLLSKNLPAIINNKPTKNFVYNDKGSMATIGRNKAVVDLPRFKFKGFFAWVVWLIVHLFSIIGVKNKIFVFINWVWGYFSYDQSLRLIIKPAKRLKHREDDAV